VDVQGAADPEIVVLVADPFSSPKCDAAVGRPREHCVDGPAALPFTVILLVYLGRGRTMTGGFPLTAKGGKRLSKEIVVNADARETRIAVREDGQLVELHIEREERVVGSIYKARVENVLPGMDAAFVDIGWTATLI
jgi:hypothetical protein